MGKASTLNTGATTGWKSRDKDLMVRVWESDTREWDEARAADTNVANLGLMCCRKKEKKIRFRERKKKLISKEGGRSIGERWENVVGGDNGYMDRIGGISLIRTQGLLLELVMLLYVGGTFVRVVGTREGVHVWDFKEEERNRAEAS